ncbi:hypothetical protein GOP47_0028546 [Adiantum capillus-veneris]|nr:hypothetical protein GOP47_0028546 [Adiantum capillus-veneris]
MHTATRSSQHNAEVSSRIEKALGTSMQVTPEASSHPQEAPKQAKKEAFQRTGRSVLSLALRSHDASHRRTRSFSPLRMFQRNDHLPACPSTSSSSISAPTMEQEDTYNLPQEISAKEKQHDCEPTSAQKGSIKRWTLKDLLHRKSGGENRWNSSRSSSRHSGASADSTSSVEKMCGKSSTAGRSSSESSQSFASVHTSTKDVITSTGTSSSRTKTLVRESMDGYDQADSSQKGPKNITGSVLCRGHDSSAISDVNVKSSTQKVMKAHVQHGNPSSEVQWRMHKAQSERGTFCQENAAEVQLNMHQLQPTRGTLCEVNNSNIINNNGKAKSTSQRGLAKHKGNKGCISPHEMHYVMHKQQTEELRRRTFLPYRQGLLGCLGFSSRSYRTVSTISKTLQSIS